MNTFVEWFFSPETTNLVDKINDYAERNSLKIISISTNNNLTGAVVLFEGKKPRYKW